jgi:rhodanese-related sulfurtransferase
MTIKSSIFILFLAANLLTSFACAQIPNNKPTCQSKAFDQTLSTMLQFSVPVIGVKELKNQQKNYIVLDAREQKEYDVSHIEGAKHIGYEQFDIKKMKDIKKDAPIVVYCSVGYRSEKIGEKLQKEGFSNVKNLYGSIFEWVNESYPLVDGNNQEVLKVHTYNTLWGKWVRNKKIVKIVK